MRDLNEIRSVGAAVPKRLCHGALETMLKGHDGAPCGCVALASFYRFDPFLEDIGASTGPAEESEVDTVVVPARTDGFADVFLKEDRWYAIRLHGTMRPADQAYRRLLGRSHLSHHPYCPGPLGRAVEGNGQICGQFRGAGA